MGFLSFKIDVIYFFILQQPCTFNHNFLLRSVLLFFFVSAKLHPCMHKWTSLRIDNKWMKGSHVLNTKMYTFHPTMTIKKTLKLEETSKMWLHNLTLSCLFKHILFNQCLQKLIRFEIRALNRHHYLCQQWRKGSLRTKMRIAIWR